jgi:2-phospho-L-lactate guanylyltransferase
MEPIDSTGVVLAHRCSGSLDDVNIERQDVHSHRKGGMSLRASRLWAVIPVKNIENAKQRLAPALAPDERRRLFRAMVEDVLAVLSRCQSLAGVIMVTRDPEAVSLAEHYGARVLIEEKNAGHTAASSLGAKTLAAEGVAGMIQIPGDLPAITPDDVETVLAVHADAPAVTIVPSSDELGSNAVACSPPDLLPLRFGDNSFVPHVESARKLGLDPVIVRREGIALDIDTPNDLRTFLAAPTEGGTLNYLRESGIAARLSADETR